MNNPTVNIGCMELCWYTKRHLEIIGESWKNYLMTCTVSKKSKNSVCMQLYGGLGEGLGQDGDLGGKSQVSAFWDELVF